MGASGERCDSELWVLAAGGEAEVKIYAVNSGCYSDFRINGLFSTRENAEAYMRAFPNAGYDGYNEIDEYDVDEGVSEVRQGLVVWVVDMMRDGDTISVKKWDSMDECAEKPKWSDRRYDRDVNEIQLYEWVRFYLWARDEAHAVKIANERRIMELAQRSAKVSS